MWPFRRRPKRSVESIPTQLKIIRAHIAAMTSELSTTRVLLQRQSDYTAIMLERLDRKRES